MKKILSKLTVLASALFFCGCEAPNANVDPNPGGGNGTQGKLSINVERNGDYAVTTKAATVEEKDFQIEVVNANGVVVLNKKYGDLDPVEGVSTGTGYTVKASWGKNLEAGFDAPYYYGESKLDIYPDIVNTVLVESKVANMKVNVNVSDRFKEFYGADYEIFVRNASYVKEGDPELVFTSTETRDGYLKPGKIIVKVRGRQTVKSFEIADGKAADHHIIAIDLVSTSNLGASIIIDHTLNNINSGILVPSDDETLGNGGVESPDFGGDEGPGGDDGGDTDVTPGLTGEGFNIDETLVLKIGKDIVMVDGALVCQTPVKALVSAPGKIEKLIVDIESDELAPLLPALFGEQGWFDIANPTEEQRINLESFTILQPGEVVKGVKSYTFDVTKFMGLLGINNGKPHNFHITLTDAFGQNLQKTLSVQIVE